MMPVHFNKQLEEKTMESMASVLPITAIVLILSITIAPLEPGTLVLFLFGAVLLIPNNLPNRFRPPVYMLINAAHGFLYGTLYAPAQALLFGMDFDGTIAWILAGLPWDMIHGIGNLFCGILIAPLILLLRQLGRIDFNH